MPRLLGAGNYTGVVGTDAVQFISHQFNLGGAGVVNAGPIAFGLPRGLFNVIIQDDGVAGPGNGFMTFFVKGGLTTNIGDYTSLYFINSHPRTNFDAAAASFSTGPNTLVVTNDSTNAEYTLILNSRAGTATLEQTAGVPAGDVLLTISIFSF